jgi:hypothetical protein
MASIRSSKFLKPGARKSCDGADDGVGTSVGAGAGAGVGADRGTRAGGRPWANSEHESHGEEQGCPGTYGCLRCHCYLVTDVLSTVPVPSNNVFIYRPACIYSQ